VTSNADSDETGIIVAGVGTENPPHFYVLDDLSLSASPDTWARVLVLAYLRQKADRIIGEVNNGGDLIETIIRHVEIEGKKVGANASYKAVHASRGKAIRAEPISALYEQNRVHHVGAFPVLEDQLCDWDPATSTDSPDRLDALVWALTELSGDPAGPIKINPGLLGRMRR
jgi:phage terminase large subunit-like protein